MASTGIPFGVQFENDLVKHMRESWGTSLSLILCQQNLCSLVENLKAARKRKRQAGDSLIYFAELDDAEDFSTSKTSQHKTGHNVRYLMAYDKFPKACTTQKTIAAQRIWASR